MQFFSNIEKQLDLSINRNSFKLLQNEAVSIAIVQ